MRLINADSFLKDIKGWQEDIQDNEYDANKFDFVFERIYEMFEEIPTAYDIDKVVKELEENASRYTKKYVTPYGNNGYKDTKAISIHKAIEIVQEVAEEYNGGWIACSEKLPELRQDVLVTVKYTGFMGMHGYWIKTGHMEAENDWWGDCAGGEVIAWQPLPEPFKERD